MELWIVTHIRDGIGLLAQSYKAFPSSLLCPNYIKLLRAFSLFSSFGRKRTKQAIDRDRERKGEGKGNYNFKEI